MPLECRQSPRRPTIALVPTRLVTVHIDDERLEVGYDSGRIHHGFQFEWEALTADDEMRRWVSRRTYAEAKAAVEAVAATVVSWDLVEDDGLTPIPVTTESVRSLPLYAVYRIWYAVRDDALDRPADLG